MAVDSVDNSIFATFATKVFNTVTFFGVFVFHFANRFGLAACEVYQQSAKFCYANFTLANCFSVLSYKNVDFRLIFCGKKVCFVDNF